MARTLCRRSPRGPAEETNEVIDVLLIGNKVRRQTTVVGIRAKVLRVVVLIGLECRNLVIGPLQHACFFVIAVGAEFFYHGLFGGGGRINEIGDTVRVIFLAGMVEGAAQVLRRIVRAQVGAVPQHGTVLLQTAGLIQRLTVSDFVLGEDRFARGLGDNLFRQRHGCVIGAVRQKSHDQKAKDHDEGDALHPHVAHLEDRFLPVFNPSRGGGHKVSLSQL